MRYFPKIFIIHADNRHEGIAGLKLRSILKGNLILDHENLRVENGQHDFAFRSKREQQAREALFHAISSWPPYLSLELHLTSLPDLFHRAQSHLMISIFLRAFSSTEEKAKEEIISRYLSLMPLLSAHLLEAEFIPITSKKDLHLRKSLFNPSDALVIHRRQEALSLSTLLKRLSVGFGDLVPRNCDENNVVNHLFPWVPSLDDWSRLIDTLIGQLDPIQIIIRVRPKADNKDAIKRLDRVIQSCEHFLSGIKEYQITLKRQTGLIRDISLKQLSGIRENGFDVGVFVLAPYPIDPSIANLIGKAITGPQDGSDENNLFRGGFSLINIRVEDALKGDFFPEKEPFTISEAASAFRLPSPPLQEHPGLPVKRSRTSFALIPFINQEDNGSVAVVYNEHQGMIVPVVMAVDDRMHHTFIIGQTGTGKSTLMERMILQDIRAGRGLAVIDPHGVMVDSILGKIPGERAEDVILFDMLDRERPLGFNLIQWRTLEERDLIIDELYLTLARIYDMSVAGGPIFETNFRGMLKLLMGENHREDFVPTILEFTSCYLNRSFRDYLKNSIKDSQVLDFIEELEKTGREGSLQNLSPYITSKFGRFIHDTSLKRIVGQEKTSFDFEEIMNKGKILLTKLGKGRFGATVSALLVNQIVARFKLAAMKRGDMKCEERKDFFLYVDECHNLPSENFMELLSEARKFRLGLILSTQYTAQLANAGSRENELLSAILGNVGTTLIFRLGQEDAVKLYPVLQPYFSSLDIVGLANWHGYARLQLNQDSIPPFSFRTEKDGIPYDEEVASYMRRLSRMKYGSKAKDIDAQIKKRRSIINNSRTLDLG